MTARSEEPAADAQAEPVSKPVPWWKTLVGASATQLPDEIPPLDEYLQATAIPTSAIFTTVTMTSAYIKGVASLPLTFYGSLLTGGLGSAVFFGSAYLSRYLRKEDDGINYGIGAAVTATAFNAPRKGWKVGMASGVVGAGAGVLGHFLTNLFYQYTRRNYIEYRRFMIEDSVAMRVKDFYKEPQFDDKRLQVDLGRATVRDIRVPRAQLPELDREHTAERASRASKPASSP